MFRSHSDFKFEDHPSIIAASRIVITGGCQIHRVVLRKENSGGREEYVTHMENVRLDGDTWKHGDFYWGHYFLGNAEAAHKDFNERCGKL